jgi:hypothetical protein
MRLTKHVYPSAILNFHAFNRVSLKEQNLLPPHTTKPDDFVRSGWGVDVVATGIVNEPVGMSAMPSAVMTGTNIKRKNLAATVLITVTAVCEP